MKYVLTGAAGNITGPLAKQLLASGASVTVIGRNAARLTQPGIQAAVGSLEDIEFLTRTFEGADAVYTMIPPNPTSNDQMGFHEKLANNYAAAIQQSGIRHVVNLSSIGAHLPEGGGLPSGLYRVEKILNSLALPVRHLRAGYFYSNLFSNIGLIKQLGIMGSNFSANRLPVAAASDIARVAAEELFSSAFTGQPVRYVASDETATDELAGAIGAAIEQSLQWVKMKDEQVMGALLQFGFCDNAARHIVQTGKAIDAGILMEDYYLHPPQNTGAIKVTDFAHQFSNLYHA